MAGPVARLPVQRGQDADQGQIGGPGGRERQALEDRAVRCPTCSPMVPTTACTTGWSPGSPRSGPSAPNPEIEQ